MAHHISSTFLNAEIVNNLGTVISKNMANLVHLLAQISRPSTR